MFSLLSFFNAFTLLASKSVITELNQDTACAFLDFTSQFALQGLHKIETQIKKKEIGWSGGI